MIIFRVLILASLWVTAIAQASTNAVGGLLIKKSNEYPNIVWLSIDDVGRETYGALNSPFKANSGSQTWSDGDSFAPLTASMTPGLNRLLAKGIDFEGVWAGQQCTTSRAMLSSGSRATPTSPPTNISPKQHIQIASGNVYRMMNGGKSQLGSNGASVDAEGLPPAFGGTCDDLSLTPGRVRPPGQTEGEAHWIVGEYDLGYASVWSRTWTYLKCPSIPPSPAPAALATIHSWTPGNATNDGYVYMDEATTDVALEFIREDAFGGGNPRLLWDNHYAKPFVVAIGYHTLHGDSMQDLSGFVTSAGADYGQVQIDDHIKTGIGYTTKKALTYPSDVLESFDAITSFPQAGYLWTENCPGYPNGDGSGPPNSIASTDKKIQLDSWMSCAVTKMVFVDYQIERFLNALGEAGLQNTLIVFTGDNGTNGSQIPNTDGLNKGANAPLDPSVGAVVCGNYCGKGTRSETGLNVPFIMAGGPISRSNYGTASKLRLSNVDVAETIIQTVVPSSSRYTPEGRDFTSLYGADCSSGACDNLAGFEITLSRNIMPRHGSAVQELTNGKIFRVMRFCGTELDWVQDLAATDPNADLRSLVISSGTTELDVAYAALSAALDADGFTETISCP